MIGFDEAIAIITEAARPLETVSVPVADADGLVLAADVIAAIDAPRRDVSAMDGYALRESDLGQLPARLRVTGESAAGQAEPPPFATGECVRIFTGAALPAGADRVIVQEAVERDGDSAVFADAPGAARHIRAAASDFALGDTLLAAGTRLGPGALVAAAGADLARVEAWRRPRFLVLATGDELAEPGSARTDPAAIPDSVSLGVATLGRRWGGECLGRRRLADERRSLERAARMALADADLVVVTGGASVGERDFAKAMFERSGLELLFSKVAIKPGKPVWLGRAGARLVLGLPGNPTSALVTARLFLAPLLSGMSGGDPTAALSWRAAPLDRPIGATGDRETFLLGEWSGGRVRPGANRDSGAQKALAEASLLIRRVSATPPADAGDTAEVLDFYR